MAIVYSYPKVTSPLATDVLVLTDTTVTAGKRKNKTKSIAMSDVATYVINSKSGITGSGTVNKLPIFTASTVVGDSQLEQAGPSSSGLYQMRLNNADRFIINKPSSVTSGDPEFLIQQDGNFKVSFGWDDDGDGYGYIYNWAGKGLRLGAAGQNPQFELNTVTPEIISHTAHLFDGTAQFEANIKVNAALQDSLGNTGTAGQVLTSTGTGVAWATDAGGSVTGTGTTNYIAKWNTSSSIQNSIIFDNGTNVGVGTATPQAKLHVNGQTAFLVTDGNETGLEVNNGSYIYKIGDISGGENQSYMQIDSAASKAFFLNSNIGIGTTSPSNPLTVVGVDSVGIDDYILHNGDSNTKFGFPSNDTFKIRTSGTDRFNIDSSGNVGIGTSSPSAKLQVSSSGDTVVKITSANGNAAFLDLGDASDTDGGRIVYDSGSNLALYTASSERMRIKNNGNIGIGTTSPAQLLHVQGNNATIQTVESGGATVRMRSGSIGRLGTYSNNNLMFVSNSVDRMTITTAGNVGIGTTSPSAKLEVDGDIYPASNVSYSLGSSTKSFLFTNTYAVSSAGNLQLLAGGSEKMRITSTGNVGIGTTSPNRQLQVSGAGTTVAIKVKATDGSQSSLDLENTEGWFRIINDGGSLSIYDQSDSAERFRINTSGNVGIGTTNPASKLEVDGGDIEVDDSASGLILRSPNGTRYRIKVDNSGNLTTTAV